MWNCHLQLISHLKKDGPRADLWHWVVGEKIGPTWHQQFFFSSSSPEEDSNSRLLGPLLSSEFRIVISICFRTTVWLSLVYKSSLMNLSHLTFKKLIIFPAALKVYSWMHSKIQIVIPICRTTFTLARLELWKAGAKSCFDQHKVRKIG